MKLRLDSRPHLSSRLDPGSCWEASFAVGKCRRGFMGLEAEAEASVLVK